MNWLCRVGYLGQSLMNLSGLLSLRSNNGKRNQLGNNS